jgi:hypothetical protein
VLQHQTVVNGNHIINTSTSFYPVIVTHPEHKFPLHFKTEEEAINYANASIGCYEILKVNS